MISAIKFNKSSSLFDWIERLFSIFLTCLSRLNALFFASIFFLSTAYPHLLIRLHFRCIYFKKANLAEAQFYNCKSGKAHNLYAHTTTHERYKQEKSL